MADLQKTTAPGFLRDARTGAVLNDNLDEYQIARARRRQGKRMVEIEKRLEALEARIAQLEEAVRA